MKIPIYVIKTLVRVLPFLIKEASRGNLGYKDANELRLARLMLIKLKRLLEKKGGVI